jgi:hypothetical protein
MKNFVFASVLAMAAGGMLIAPALRAQDITIKDPAEFNSYSMASSQADPKAKAAALEAFLQSYPQSVVKKTVLSLLIETYQGLGDADKTVAAASKQLQLDPNNMEAITASILAKKQQAAHTQDPAEILDDAAALARKGLTVPKPADVSADDWKKQTDALYPVFHSIMAYDLMISKKDAKGAVDEFRNELMLIPAEQTTSGPALNDTLQLAEAYAKVPDALNAVWFYARAFDFAPASYKPVIEKKLKYWYTKYHGALDGLDDVKAKAAATVFPAGMVVAPAKTPAEKIHDILVSTPDLKTLALADKELVLAYGSKEDADKLWAIMKDQPTPVPGIVMEASATVIKVAVTSDAKDAKVADFVVNMKEPLAEKDIPAVGFEFKLQPGTELDGTYDTYVQVPATATAAQSAQLVLKDAFIQAEKKKAAPAHKPAAGHKPAAH